MVDLRTRSDLAVLDLDEVAHVRRLAHYRTGADAREGTGDGPGVNGCPVDVAHRQDLHIIADLHIPQHAVGTDGDAIAELHPSFQDHPDIQGDILAGAHFAADLHPGGITDGDTL